MKKLMSVFLALAMALCMSTMAFADDTSSSSKYESAKSLASEESTFTFTKSYQDPDGNELPDGIFPTETLSFKVEAVAGNPDDTMISVADSAIETNPDSITVTIPDYDNVGEWFYTITEVAGNTQGVTYKTDPIEVEVFVFWDDDGVMKKQVAFTKGGTNEGEKVDEIVNTYSVSKGDPDPDPDPDPNDQKHGLYITKQISGNMASPTQKFDIYVTFTSDQPVESTITGTVDIAESDWTLVDGVYTAKVTVSLAGGETAYFDYIPEGVEYKVEEDSSYAEADTKNMSDPAKGYTVTYVGENGTAAFNSSDAATVTNEKKADLKTGVLLDSAPYVLMGVLAAAGIALVMKKRFEV